MQTIMFLVVVLIGFSISAQVKSHEAEEIKGIKVMAYKFELKSFSINTKDLYDGGKIIECKGDVLKSSVIGRVLLDLSQSTLTSENQRRYLIPSFKPFSGRASWRIDSRLENEKTCTFMAPYFNGLGFSSFDIRDGKATIYLSSFELSSDQVDQWGEGDVLEKLSGILNPNYVVGNLVSFPARCVLHGPGVLGSFVKDFEMVCTLNENRGQVKLIGYKVNPDFQNINLVRELIDHQDLLYGEIQQPQK